MVVTDPVAPAQKTVTSPSEIPDFPTMEHTWGVMSTMSQKPFVSSEILSEYVIASPCSFDV